MATVFVVLRELIGACEDRSIWLCGTPIYKDSETFLLGDLACDRIVFKSPPFETVLQDPPIGLRSKYLGEVGKRAAGLSSEDVLVLVLVGHGEDGAFVISNDTDECELRKEEIEAVVRRTKGTIWLINTSCHSGNWESPCWSLLAAAEAN